MRFTVYDTPVVRPLCVGLSWCLFKLTGWTLKGAPPKERKFVLIAVPHTSNWDFPLTIGLAFLFGFKIFWMGKASLFRGPAGPIMKWLGGIPIDRSKANNVVEQVVEAFNQTDELVVTIPPEGTRSRVDQWKTGFYHIASGAGVPIALGFLDYATKTGGFGPTFYPSGDIDKDIAEIRQFYADKIGKHSDRYA
ncbi:lysophospholipid acyltransferase family protein [Aestuariirhabdus litorea]|uniref:Glycerol acyltransferase n=1 Tax=Aestuariirhabdus litorea TaxID=2528527 RepID=A0A3P3VSP6_9GAMM|nr:lysophospholipid acyltransferase family protein [Aestuariirhabdus litorea]RRJ83803.1 glycerol acyltransferase [Aestuariirhabdus litorea]RWW97026.1 glycerol acyltransferase [Endozoicomonadaceae bacterium GTF-13]